MTTPTDAELDVPTLQRVCGALMSNPTLAEVGDEAARGYRAAVLTVEALATGMPTSSIRAGNPDMPALVDELTKTDEWVATLDPPPAPPLGPTITLDQGNLDRLVSFVRSIPSSKALPAPMRAGYEMALKAIEAIVPTMPELYGDTGCPNIPNLLGRIGECESIDDVRAIVWPLAFDQWIGLPATGETGATDGGAQ